MVNSSEGQLNKAGNKRGMSLASRKNLVVNGNNHSAKDYSITRILKEMADDPAPERWLEVEDKGKGLTYRQAAARRIWIDVIRGNAKITGELLDRLEGKVTQPIGGANGQPLELLVRWDGNRNESSNTSEAASS